MIDVPDDIDTPLYNPSFFVYEVIRSWNESSTWNSLGGGLSPGADLGAQIGSFLGDSVPNSDSMRRINVTAAVQAWANGSPNYGLAILPQIISGNDDGIEIRSSENGNTILRPRLEITYAVTPTGPVPPSNQDHRNIQTNQHNTEKISGRRKADNSSPKIRQVL